MVLGVASDEVTPLSKKISNMSTKHKKKRTKNYKGPPMDREGMRNALVRLLMINKAKHILLNLPTGFGKSALAIEVINCIKDIKSVLLLVNEVGHGKNWETEFEKFLRKEGVECETYCYHSMHKLAGKEYDLIIVDEAHHLVTDKRKEAFMGIKSTYTVFLSATLKEDEILLLRHFRPGLKKLKVSLKNAIKSGVLPEPEIWVMHSSLDNKVANQFIKVVRDPNKPFTVKAGYDKRFFWLSKKHNPSANVLISCTEKQYYDYIESRVSWAKDNFDQQPTEYNKQVWLNACIDRKKILGEIKTSRIKHITDRIRAKGKRFVCFVSSIDQADALNYECSIHSKKNNNQVILDNFNDGQIDEIFAVGMLQEGYNLFDCEVGVISQLDAGERGVIQKIGRVLRHDKPLVVILCIDNTRDEDFLKSALEVIGDSQKVYHSK